MMDAIETALGEMNVPMSKYHSERYTVTDFWQFPVGHSCRLLLLPM
jgi:hypothetical protein